MPRILLSVPGTNESVIRPVVLDIARQIMKMTGIHEKTQILYPGDVEKTIQAGSTLTPTDQPNVLPFNERVMIEVDEDYDPERFLTAAVHRPEHLHVFRDDRIESYIKPVYSTNKLTLNIRYRSVDKNQALRWRDDIRARMAMMRDQNVHRVSYHYLIPEEFLVILKEIHRLRENVAGYGESWDEYLRANLTQRASLLTTLAGTNPTWGIAETQERLIGWFDFEGVPEKGSKEDEGDTWTISFAYNLLYDKPVACVMAYPLMVHNQLIGDAYRPTEPMDRPELHQRSYSLSTLALREYEGGAKPLGIPNGLAIPAFDEFIPGSVVSGTLRVFTALTSIDETDPQYLLSLLELGDMDLHPKIVEFLEGELPYLTKPYQSVFCLSFYQGIGLQRPDALRVDSAYKVYATSPLDLREYYHVRFALVQDFAFLSQRAIARLRNHGQALLLILQALGYNGQLPKLIGDYVTQEDMEMILRRLSLMNGNGGNNQLYSRNTVMTLFVEAYRADGQPVVSEPEAIVEAAPPVEPPDDGGGTPPPPPADPNLWGEMEVINDGYWPIDPEMKW